MAIISLIGSAGEVHYNPLADQIVVERFDDLTNTDDYCTGSCFQFSIFEFFLFCRVMLVFILNVEGHVEVVTIRPQRLPTKRISL